MEPIPIISPLKAWLSINISMRHLFHVDFISDIKSIAEKFLDKSLYSCILLEITESIAINDFKQFLLITQELKSLGFKFSLDDFGTGYSSLSYLSKMDIYELKIDRSFIIGIHRDKDKQNLVKMIIALAQSFELKVVIEGVEKQEERSYLQTYSNILIQGFLFSKPIAAHDFEKLFREYHTKTLS